MKINKNNLIKITKSEIMSLGNQYNPLESKDMLRVVDMLLNKKDSDGLPESAFHAMLIITLCAAIECRIKEILSPYRNDIKSNTDYPNKKPLEGDPKRIKQLNDKYIKLRQILNNLHNLPEKGKINFFKKAEDRSRYTETLKQLFSFRNQIAHGNLLNIISSSSLSNQNFENKSVIDKKTSSNEYRGIMGYIKRKIDKSLNHPFNTKVSRHFFDAVQHYFNYLQQEYVNLKQ